MPTNTSESQMFQFVDAFESAYVRTVLADSPLASGPTRAASASLKSPLLTQLLPLSLGAAIVHAWLPDLDAADAAGDRSLRQIAIANDLLMPVLIEAAAARFDPVGDLGADGLGEHLLSSLAEDIGEDVAAGEWHDAAVVGSMIHGGVLSGHVGRFGAFRTRQEYAAFFQPSINKI